MSFITKGKTNIKYLSIIIILAILAGVGIFWCGQRKKANLLMSSQGACAQGSEVCPGGSSVFRVGPDCEFSACPVIDAAGPASGQAYRNDEYGFEIEYPLDFEKQEAGSDTDLLTIMKKDNGSYYYFGINVIKDYKIDSIFSKVKEVDKINIGGRPGYEYFYREGAGISEVILIQAGKDALSISLDNIGSGKDFKTDDDRKIYVKNVFDQIISTFRFTN